MLSLAFIATTATLFAPVANPMDLVGQGEYEYVAPHRMFSVKIPKTWQVILKDNPNEVQFTPMGAGGPAMFIRRITVPMGASPAQLALRSIDDRLSKLPRYKLITKHNGRVGPHPATTVTASYSYQGNIQYPRVVEEVFVVVGSEAFIFHFDVSQVSASHYAGSLNRFYQSFVPHPPVPSPKKQKKNVTNMPF